MGGGQWEDGVGVCSSTVLLWFNTALSVPVDPQTATAPVIRETQIQTDAYWQGAWEEELITT